MSNKKRGGEEENPKRVKGKGVEGLKLGGLVDDGVAGLRRRGRKEVGPKMAMTCVGSTTPS